MKDRISVRDVAGFAGQKDLADTCLRYSHHARVHAASLILMICVGSAAVQVHAQNSLAAQTSAKECPDLTGTYEPSDAAWTENFLFIATGTVPPKTQTRQFVTLQPRGGDYTLIWHMRRQDVLAAVRLQAQRDPRRYGIWLDMVLRDPDLPLPLGMTEQGWFNQIAVYGPVFRVDAVLPLRRCKGGWFLILSGGRSGPADFEGGMEGTRDVEFWLGRDKDGSLSLKLQEWRKLVLLDGHYFNEVAIRLWSSAHLYKWPVAPEPDLTRIRADELPEGDRMVYRRPFGGLLPAPGGQSAAKGADRKLLIQYFVRPHAPGRGLRPNTLHGDRLGARCLCHCKGGRLPPDRPLYPADRIAGVAGSRGWRAEGEVPHDGRTVRKRSGATRIRSSRLTTAAAELQR